MATINSPMQQEQEANFSLRYALREPLDEEALSRMESNRVELERTLRAEKQRVRERDGPTLVNCLLSTLICLANLATAACLLFTILGLIFLFLS